jgi:alpha-glucosidase
MLSRFRNTCILAMAQVAVVMLGSQLVPAAEQTVASPDGNVRFHLMLEGGRAKYSVTLKDAPVIESSPIVFTIDGVDLADGAQETTSAQVSKIDESFPSRWVHSTATNHCNVAKFDLKGGKASTPFALEVRAYNDGVAFRTIVPGKDDQQRVPDEQTLFTIPAGSTVWHHNMSGHYEGQHQKHEVSQLQSGEWVAPPMTFRLPDNRGYASITEANLVDFAGMALECNGKRGFAVGLGHRQPVSHPYELRYSKEDIARLAEAAKIAGTITTPWRVIMIGPDLNALVNCDIIEACSPPADPKLFPEGLNTAWCKPGRAVWRYVDGGEIRNDRVAEVKNFSKLAGELGFEYNVVEGFWRDFSDEQLADVVKYSSEQGVKLIVWMHSKQLRDPKVRQEMFDRCAKFGVAGCKIDFFDHEAKEVIDLYSAILKEAAEKHLVLDFHGADKPTGQSRTWPNELTREAIRGMEASRLQNRSVHETTLPFTRYLAGHAEYTGMLFSPRRGDTTWAHQVAVPIILSAELLTYGSHPQKILDNPACDVIKSIPSTWDQTIVLPPSEIGELAIYARRKGDTWFLAVMNGPKEQNLKIPLNFLGDGEYKTTLVKDGSVPAPPTTQEAAAASSKPSDNIIVENATMKRGDTITLHLTHGGGFVARFTK